MGFAPLVVSRSVSVVYGCMYIRRWLVASHRCLSTHAFGRRLPPSENTTALPTCLQTRLREESFAVGKHDGLAYPLADPQTDPQWISHLDLATPRTMILQSLACPL